MRLRINFMILLFLASGLIVPLSAQDQNQQKAVRKLILNEDRNQRYMRTVVYELKHLKAVDITPWILGAVKRNNKQSDVQRLNYKFGKKQFLVVSMDQTMIPYVNDMIKKLDRPGTQDENSSIIDGTGIHRFVYYPKHRASDDMRKIGQMVASSWSDGHYYLENSTNMFYWKDSKSDGSSAMKWIKFLDRPVPQVDLKFHVYEINDNDFKELGIDYVHWKNGPGADLIGFGADIWNFKSKEQLFAKAVEKFTDIGTSWFGGMFFAPQFDASFVRMLAQKGKARIATSGNLTVVNDFHGSYNIRFNPSHQNIVKDDRMEISIVNSNNAEFELEVNSPTICFNEAGDDATVLKFNYVVAMSSVVERNNTGTEFVNTNEVSSDITLACGTEKLLAVFSLQHDVEQNNGIPFLSDIPGIKYLVGMVSHSKVYTRLFITVDASSVAPGTSLSKWAGKMISEVETIEKDREKIQKRINRK